MALNGKRVVQIEIKSNGDVFHDLWKANPQDISKISPTAIQNCNCYDGHEDGKVGSIHFWNYFHGKFMQHIL